MDEATQQTISHIRRVQELLAEVVAFAEQTERLRECTYGSDRYRELLLEIEPAIEHYARDAATRQQNLHPKT